MSLGLWLLAFSLRSLVFGLLRGRTTHAEPRPKTQDLRPKAFLPLNELSHQPVQTLRVFLIESSELWTINVQYAQQATTLLERHDDLGIRRTIAGNVSGKVMHVRNNDCLALGSGNTANSFTNFDTNTRGLALKRTQHKFFIF